MDNRAAQIQSEFITNSQSASKVTPPRRFFKLTILSLALVILVTVAGFMVWRYGKQKAMQTTPTPGFCEILEEQYCQKGKFFDWTDQGGQTYKMVGFRLPAGVNIFSPIDGHLTKGKANVEPFSSGLHAGVTKVKDPLSTVFSFFGDLQFNNMFDIDVKKGEIVARTQSQSTGVKIIKDYNFIFMPTKKNPNGNGFISDDELLYNFFPPQ